MKIQRHWVPATAIALLGGFGVTTSQENAELEGRVADLEARTEAVEAYLANQAKAAEKLNQALDASEKAGFTFGINPESREILLAAWRAQSQAVSADVPGQGSSQEKQTDNARVSGK